MTSKDIAVYEFSYTAIEYVIKSYGYNSLIELIKSPSNLERILGITNKEFENKWKAYLIENYK